MTQTTTSTFIEAVPSGPRFQSGQDEDGQAGQGMDQSAFAEGVPDGPRFQHGQDEDGQAGQGMFQMSPNPWESARWQADQELIDIMVQGEKDGTLHELLDPMSPKYVMPGIVLRAMNYVRCLSTESGGMAQCNAAEGGLMDSRAVGQNALGVDRRELMAVGNELPLSWIRENGLSAHLLGMSDTPLEDPALREKLEDALGRKVFYNTPEAFEASPGYHKDIEWYPGMTIAGAKSAVDALERNRSRTPEMEGGSGQGGWQYQAEPVTEAARSSAPEPSRAEPTREKALPPASTGHYENMSKTQKKEEQKKIEELSFKNRDDVLVDAWKLSEAERTDRMAVLDQLALAVDFKTKYTEEQRRRMEYMAVAAAAGPEYLQKIVDYANEHDRLTRLAQKPGGMLDGAVLTQRTALEDGYESRFAFEATFSTEFVRQQTALAKLWQDNLTTDAFCGKIQDYKQKLAATDDPAKRKTLMLRIAEDIITTAGIPAKQVVIAPLPAGVLGRANSESLVITLSERDYTGPDLDWERFLSTLFHEGAHIVQYKNKEAPDGDFARIAANRRRVIRSHIWGYDHYRWQPNENHAFYMGRQAKIVYDQWKK